MYMGLLPADFNSGNTPSLGSPYQPILCAAVPSPTKILIYPRVKSAKRPFSHLDLHSSFWWIDDDLR